MTEVWECVICLDGQHYPMVSIACGHTICLECSNKNKEKCPECRKQVTGYVPNYGLGRLYDKEFKQSSTSEITEERRNKLMKEDDDLGFTEESRMDTLKKLPEEITTFLSYKELFRIGGLSETYYQKRKKRTGYVFYEGSTTNKKDSGLYRCLSVNNNKKNDDRLYKALQNIKYRGGVKKI